MEQIVKLNIGGTVTAAHREDGVVITDITDARCQVFSPTGTVLKSESPAAVDQDGVMSVELTAEEAAHPLDWCRAHFTFTAAGEQQAGDVYFHIAAQEFDIPVYMGDLLLHATYLKNRAPEDDPDFGGARRAALSALYSRLANAGRKPWKIINLSSLDTTFLHLWISLVCSQLSTSGSGIWSERAEDNRAMFEDELARVNLVESSSGSRNSAEGDEQPLFRSRIRRA